MGILHCLQNTSDFWILYCNYFEGTLWVYKVWHKLSGIREPTLGLFLLKQLLVWLIECLIIWYTLQKLRVGANLEKTEFKKIHKLGGGKMDKWNFKKFTAENMAFMVKAVEKLMDYAFTYRKTDDFQIVAKQNKQFM